MPAKAFQIPEVQNGTYPFTGTITIMSINADGMECAVCCEYFARDREMVPGETQTGESVLVCTSSQMDENTCGMMCPQGLPVSEIKGLFTERIDWVRSQGWPKR